MRELLHLGFGGVLGSAAWLIPRRVAAAGPTGFGALALDLLPVVVGGGLLLLLLSARDARRAS
jgi:hypothetical protein